MKIHLFRRKDGESASSIYIGDRLESKYPLYAFTPDKKIAARFMAERDMSKFLYIQVKKDRDEAHTWMHQHRINWLDIRQMETYTNKNTEKQLVKWANILVTENEVSYVEETIESSPVNIVAEYCGLVSDEVFTDEIRDALATLGYRDMYALYEDSMLYVDTDMHWSDITTGVTLDPLGVFVMLYGDLLTDAFFENLRITDKE